MASNEEIRNQYQLPYTVDATLDSVRSSEVLAWEEWRRENVVEKHTGAKTLYQVITNYSIVGWHSLDEAYSIFKQSQSK